jgi:hypothetical protein
MKGAIFLIMSFVETVMIITAIRDYRFQIPILSMVLLMCAWSYVSGWMDNDKSV